MFGSLAHIFSVDTLPGIISRRLVSTHLVIPFVRGRGACCIYTLLAALNRPETAVFRDFASARLAAFFIRGDRACTRAVDVINEALKF